MIMSLRWTLPLLLLLMSLLLYLHHRVLETTESFPTSVLAINLSDVIKTMHKSPSSAKTVSAGAKASSTSDRGDSCASFESLGIFE